MLSHNQEKIKKSDNIDRKRVLFCVETTDISHIIHRESSPFLRQARLDAAFRVVCSASEHLAAMHLIILIINFLFLMRQLCV